VEGRIRIPCIWGGNAIAQDKRRSWQLVMLCRTCSTHHRFPFGVKSAIKRLLSLSYHDRDQVTHGVDHLTLQVHTLALIKRLCHHDHVAGASGEASMDIETEPQPKWGAPATSDTGHGL
jgi:hypothetical protein